MTTTAIIGAAGEYLVMSRLLARGYTAALAPQFAPNIDIVVTSSDGTLLKSIQVKTSRNPKSWRFTQKAETINHRNLYYCLVYMDGTDDLKNVVHVVPSEDIARVVAQSHARWLLGTKKSGAPRKDSAIRSVRTDHSRVLGPDTSYGPGWLDKYREAWDLLRLDAAP